MDFSSIDLSLPPVMILSLARRGKLGSCKLEHGIGVAFALAEESSFLQKCIALTQTGDRLGAEILLDEKMRGAGMRDGIENFAQRQITISEFPIRVVRNGRNVVMDRSSFGTVFQVHQFDAVSVLAEKVGCVYSGHADPKRIHFQAD